MNSNKVLINSEIKVVEFYDSIRKKRVVKTYNESNQITKLEVFDNQILEQLQTFKHNFLDSVYFFNTKSELIRVEEFVLYHDTIPFLNTYRDYDEFGKIDFKSSYFYEIETIDSCLWVRLEGTFFNEGLNLFISDFDSLFRQLGDVKLIEGHGFNVCLPIDSIQDNDNFRFIMHDRHQINDTVFDNRAICVDYSKWK